MRGANALPAAMFASSVVIALGIYFGLRARGSTAQSVPIAAPPSEVAAPPSASSASLASADPSARIVPPSVAPFGAAAAPVAPVADEAIVKEARAALEKSRARLVEKCWKPAAQKKKDPASAKYTFTILFDAEGRERARAISDVDLGESGRPDVGHCLRDVSSPVSITPTHAPATVEITLTLP